MYFPAVLKIDLTLHLLKKCDAQIVNTFLQLISNISKIRAKSKLNNYLNQRTSTFTNDDFCLEGCNTMKTFHKKFIKFSIFRHANAMGQIHKSLSLVYLVSLISVLEEEKTFEFHIIGAS